MQKIQQGQQGQVTFTVIGPAGDAVAADAPPTFTVTNPDATVSFSGTAVAGVGTGVYYAAITPAQSATMDTYVMTATATIAAVTGNIFTAQYEVCGGHYFTVAEARSFDKAQLASLTDYPTTKILAARDQVAEDIEREVLTSFVPRAKRERIVTDNRLLSSTTANLAMWPAASSDVILTLMMRNVRRIRSVTVDGVLLDSIVVGQTGNTPGYIAGLTLEYDAGEVLQMVPWRGVIDIVYEYGYDSCPAPVKYAAQRLLLDRVTTSNMDRRMRSHTDPTGTTQIAMPGDKDTPFGIPEVDAIVRRFQDRDYNIG